MDYITPDGQEKYGINASYKDGDVTKKEHGSVVKARAIEVLLRELHNVIDLVGIEPSETDHTQLYQAMRDIGLGWSETRNYRKPTLVLGSNDKLYFFIKPSGSQILLSDGRYAGPKNPLSFPTYWEEFTIFKDNGVNNLDVLINEIKVHLDNLEPTIREMIDSSLTKLIELHPNNGIATNDILGHVTSGTGVKIDDYGKADIVIDNETLLVNNDTNQLYVNESMVKPKIATTKSVGIIKVGTGLNITPVIDTPSNGYISGKLSIASHESGNPNTYGLGTSTQFGHVRLTDDFEQNSSAKDGVILSPYGALLMKNKLLGLKISTTITTSRTYTVPETAVYTITAVGGGGNGGTGGNGHFNMCSCSSDDGYCRRYVSGGGGGGGGAGETITTTIQLTKGQQIAVTIGGSGGGTTTFGALVTARGGGNGGTGGNSSLQDCNLYIGSGGSLGTNYGVGGSNGSSGVYKDGVDCRPAVAPGYGGAGATSVYGSGYGSGGNGGNGQTNIQDCKNNVNGPYGGTTGVQGVCVITPKVG